MGSLPGRRRKCSITSIRIGSPDVPKLRYLTQVVDSILSNHRCPCWNLITMVCPVLYWGAPIWGKRNSGQRTTRRFSSSHVSSLLLWKECKLLLMHRVWWYYIGLQHQQQICDCFASSNQNQEKTKKMTWHYIKSRQDTPNNELLFMTHISLWRVGTAQNLA